MGHFTKKRLLYTAALLLAGLTTLGTAEMVREAFQLTIPQGETSSPSYEVRNSGTIRLARAASAVGTPTFTLNAQLGSPMGAISLGTDAMETTGTVTLSDFHVAISGTNTITATAEAADDDRTFTVLLVIEK